MEIKRRQFMKAGIAGAVSVSSGGLLQACGGGTEARTEFSDYDASGLAALLRSKSVSPLELVEDTIRKIEAINPSINAVVTKLYERARMRAAEPLGTGPFAGVPSLLKDISDARGIRITSGSRALKNNIGTTTAPFVAAMEDSGLNFIGVTNVPELGLTDSSENLLFGATRNPWNLEFSAGGSSGGSAAAVAAGIVPLAHGNDGGGSLRIPASHCGLFALKPSRGRHINAHANDLPFGIGVDLGISRSVRDCARLLSIVEDPQSPLPKVGFVGGQSSRRLKVGLLWDGASGVPPDPTVRTAILDTANLCRSLGHNVEEVQLPFDYGGIASAFFDVWAAVAAASVDSIATALGISKLEDNFDPWTLGLCQEALSKGGPFALIAAAGPVFLQTAAQLDLFLQQWDVILSPVVRGPVIKLGQRDAGATSYAEVKQRIVEYSSYTALHNACGTPAMSVPLYWDANGLPIGSQFAARAGSEALLLGLAYELEEARPWAQRRPPHFAG